MLSDTVQKALNDQINYEFHAAYLYLSMSAYFEASNLPGFAQWMRVQSQEEVEHAMKIFDFIYDRGGRVALQTIDGPAVEFATAADAFAKALEHEKKVTGLINQLYALATKEDDYATQVMLQWFIDEQVEEEKSVGDALEMVQAAGDNPWNLMLISERLGQREEPHEE